MIFNKVVLPTPFAPNNAILQSISKEKLTSFNKFFSVSTYLKNPPSILIIGGLTLSG